MGHRTLTGRDWALIDWDGIVRCPWHGHLAPTQEYKPGPALCGCEFVRAPGGVLRAIRQPETTVPAGLELQTDARNAG
jgi:hypothetical protein